MKLPTHFGQFGGMFVSELLVPALTEVENGWIAAQKDASFQSTLRELLRDYAGRPTPLYKTRALSEVVGCPVYLKREDLLHGGAHKTNNTLGQALLAKTMGKRRLIAETGAGQHGVATAMAGALMGMEVDIFMGAKDVERQSPNVSRMRLFGARVHPVTSGSQSLKDAINDTLRHWTEHASEAFYVFGTAAGPHPYPTIVRELQRVIGEEIREEILRREGRLPTSVIACIGGGSNAIGAFAAFLDDASVQLIGVEAGGHGLASGAHGATMARGRPGVVHGSYSYLLQNADGQVTEAHSVSAGLDYPGVGPEHSFLHESKRATYVPINDKDAVNAFQWLARNEGILPALESAHAVAYALSMPKANADDLIVINLSGRGDKDLDHVIQLLNKNEGAA